MMPHIRSDEHLCSVPKLDLVKSDVKNFTNELSVSSSIKSRIKT